MPLWYLILEIIHEMFTLRSSCVFMNCQVLVAAETNGNMAPWLNMATNLGLRIDDQVSSNYRDIIS